MARSRRRQFRVRGKDRTIGYSHGEQTDVTGCKSWFKSRTYGFWACSFPRTYEWATLFSQGPKAPGRVGR